MVENIPLEAKKKLSAAVVIKNYFGYKTGDTLRNFAEELHALSEEEKLQLAKLAAVELNVEVE